MTRDWVCHHYAFSAIPLELCSAQSNPLPRFPIPPRAYPPYRLRPPLQLAIRNPSLLFERARQRQTTRDLVRQPVNYMLVPGSYKSGSPLLQ